MIKWRDPNKELPESGRDVVILLRHWKKIVPGSYEMFIGKVHRYDGGMVMVECWDERGYGSESEPLIDPNCRDCATGWLYWEEFPFPELPS